MNQLLFSAAATPAAHQVDMGATAYYNKLTAALGQINFAGSKTGDGINAYPTNSNMYKNNDYENNVLFALTHDGNGNLKVSKASDLVNIINNLSDGDVSNADSTDVNKMNVYSNNKHSDGLVTTPTSTSQKEAQAVYDLKTAVANAGATTKEEIDTPATPTTPDNSVDMGKDAYIQKLRDSLGSINFDTTDNTENAINTVENNVLNALYNLQENKASDIKSDIDSLDPTNVNGDASGNNVQKLVNVLESDDGAASTGKSLTLTDSLQHTHTVNHVLAKAIVQGLDNISNTTNTDDTLTLDTAANTALTTVKVEGEVKGVINGLQSAVSSNEDTNTTTTPAQQTSTQLYDGPYGYLNQASYAAAAADGNVIAGLNEGNDSLAVSELNSTATSAGSQYNNSSVASASYAKATDQDVTISSKFASYYNSMANSNATLANAAKASLDNFRDTHASNPEAYASANNAYESASAAEPNDRDFAYAYGKNVLLNTPEYVTVVKNAMLHSDTQYAKKNSVESVKAGTQFTVKGVGFDLAGNVRYVVADHKGKNLYLTANDAYVKNTYLAPSVDYTVTLDKDAIAHSTLGFHKDAKGTIPAGTQLEGYTVPTSTKSGRRDAAYGVTRLQVKGTKFNGDYITTNSKYFSNVTENSSNNDTAANQQNTNPVQNTINFAD